MNKESNSFKNKIHIIATLSLLVLALFAFAMPASAAITAAFAANPVVAAGVNNQTLQDFVITSTLAGDINTAGVVITLPIGTGRTFNTAGTVTAVGTGALLNQVGTITVTPDTITVQINAPAGAGDLLRVSNIRVDVTNATGGRPVTVDPGEVTETIRASAANGSATDTFDIVTMALNQQAAINLRAGVNGQTDATFDVRLETNTNLAGEIGTGTLIRLTLPAGRGITFNRSHQVSVDDDRNFVLSAPKIAAVSADGLMLSVTADRESVGIRSRITFNDLSFNTTAGALNNTEFGALTTTRNAVTVTSAEQTAFSIVILVPGVDPATAFELAAGGTQLNDSNGDFDVVTPAGSPAGLIGNGTSIIVTLPSGAGIVFDRSSAVSVDSDTGVVAGPKAANISADGLTLSTTADADSLADVNTITFSSVRFNVTAAASSTANFTLTTTPAGGVPMTSTRSAAGSDVAVFRPTVTGNSTILVDLDGNVSDPGSDIVITTSVADDQIGNNTMINITLPGTGVTFDLSAPVTVTGTGNLATQVSSPANISADGLRLSTNVSVESAPGDTVTFSGIRFNATGNAVTATLSITTTANGTNAQSVTNNTLQVIVVRSLADSIVLVAGNLAPAVSTTNTYVWNVTNATTGPFGGQTVVFTTTAGTLNATSGITDSNGNVSVNLTITTSTPITLNATIQGTNITNTTIITAIAGQATKLAIFPDIPKVAPNDIATITVTAQDSLGNNNTTVTPTVQFSVSGDAFIIGAATKIMVAGSTTFTVRKTTPGTTLLTAIDTAAVNPLTPATGQQVFTSDIGSIVLTAAPASILVNGTAVLSAQLRDLAGANLALPDEIVTFAVNNITFATLSNTTLSGQGTLTARTNAAGIATVNLTGIAIGTVSANASVTNRSNILLTSPQVNVQITPPVQQVLTNITVTPAAAAVSVGNTTNFTATARDQNNTPMAGIVISWTSSNTTVGTVAPASATTDANGNATTTFTASVVGTATITAASGNVSGNATVTVTIPGQLTTITVTPAIANVTVNTTATFTATARDQNNAPMAGVVISWTSSNTTVGTVAPASATTDANGIATTTFTASSVVGTTTITAASGNVSGIATARTSIFSPEVKAYDFNNDEIIQRDEAVASVVDFFANRIPRQTAVDVVVTFFG